MKRGDIYYIERFQTTGSEQHPGRPAVIVSNNDNNRHSTTVEVVYLTTQPKENLPTHARVNSCMRDSIAICEQITTVALERVGDYKGHVTDCEMAEIEAAMLASLDLGLLMSADATEGSDDYCYDTSESDMISELTEKLRNSEAKREMLQQMYDALLNKVVKVN
ncbi:MAG: type II toxin-antitoxin system PemK/MazF family toxin [Ruminococcaceae bacterium]|nr:type II toxin-antitoxin system PemK/MazF family toxin [Oscillospiraceae bacterium]